MSKRSRAKRDEKFADHPFKIFRIKRLTELFDCDASTVWRWQKSGLLPPPVRVGGIRGWTAEQIETFMKHREVADA
jgi:predicted DNA-binding transcriptional regulator AlpA